MSDVKLTNLISRLREHAAMHADLAKHSDESAQWAKDLYEAADLLAACGAAEPRADLADLLREVVAADDSNVDTATTLPDELMDRIRAALSRQVEPTSLRCPDCGKAIEGEATVSRWHECSLVNRRAE